MRYGGSCLDWIRSRQGRAFLRSVALVRARLFWGMPLLKGEISRRTFPDDLVRLCGTVRFPDCAFSGLYIFQTVHFPNCAFLGPCVFGTVRCRFGNCRVSAPFRRCGQAGRLKAGPPSQAAVRQPGRNGLRPSPWSRLPQSHERTFPCCRPVHRPLRKRAG